MEGEPLPLAGDEPAEGLVLAPVVAQAPMKNVPARALKAVRLSRRTRALDVAEVGWDMGIKYPRRGALVPLAE